MSTLASSGCPVLSAGLFPAGYRQSRLADTDRPGADAIPIIVASACGFAALVSQFSAIAQALPAGRRR